MDYTPWGRVVNVFIILIAVAVVGVPFGLVSSGFSDVLEQRKQAAAAEGKVSLVADLESMTLTATTAGGEQWSAEVKDGHTLDQLKRAAQRALGVRPSAPKQRVEMTDDEDDGAPLILGSAASDPHRRKAMCEQMQENVCAFLEGA